MSYSAIDSDWVKNNLIVLETNYNFSLCFHERDWLPRRDIAENIVHSMENSRKTILIVSNAYAMSQWCHFELAMVQTRGTECDLDNLILVLLEEIDDCNLSPRLRLQMKRQTYIEWPECNETGQHLFWAKLCEALKQPSESVVSASPDYPGLQMLKNT